MAWPARTWIVGELVDATIANAYWRDPLTDLRAGGVALSGQAAHDFIYAASPTQLGRVAAVAGRIPQYNGAQQRWDMVLPIQAHFPVGIIVKYDVATNPADLLGFGTWTQYGAGRCRIAYDASDPDYDTVGETGGSKTVTLTTAQLPAHTHVQDAHNHTQNPHSHTASNLANIAHSDTASTPPPLSSVADNAGTKTTSSVTATNQSTAAVNQSTGGGGAHDNLMPYITAYVWRRAA